MNEKNVEIIEYIMQLRISDFIKNNKDMDKKELARKIEEILEEKEKMYNMNDEELKEILKNNKY